MNARQPNAAQIEKNSSTSALLLEVEMPQTSAFERFEAELDASLMELEERFSDFITRDSLAGSIGR